MFGIKVLVEKLNSLIDSGTLSDLDIARAFGAIESIEKNGINSVQSLTDLPPAVNNKGRFFFVVNEAQYVVSDGSTWRGKENIIREPVPLGTLYAWGNGSRGQIGNNATTARSSPVSVVGGFTDWVQVDLGQIHSLGVRSNGTVWAWGNGAFGRLGDNTTISKSSPVSVVGGFTDWTQVSAGYRHSLGVRANGTAWGWGRNDYGQLGDNSASGRSSPVSVLGGFTDWVQVAAGDEHSAGIRANGTAWCWGNGNQGILGDNTTVAKRSPVSVVGGFTDWTQISLGKSGVVGTYFSIGLRSNGTIWGWGTNTLGQLGTGNQTTYSSPVSVIGGFTDWVQVSAGGTHTLALRANGTAWAWGCNASGRLGDETTTFRTSPVSIVGGESGWVQLAAGITHSIGIKYNGTAWAWGNNTYGRLGDNTTVDKSSPIQVPGSSNQWVLVAAGGEHSASIDYTGQKWSE